MASHPRQIIDAQLVELEACFPSPQKQIRDLKIRRNTYAIISKLPDDVLLEIFAVAQTIFPEDKWYREVTHVCHRWRCIAIEAATLWTNPPLLRHHFAMLALERSKSADLTICMESEFPHKTVKEVLNCINRIENLKISLEMDSLDDICELMATCGQQAARLRRLTLHNLSGNTSWDSESLFGLSTVFCKLQLLRELVITNINFNWKNLPLRSLVSLIFTNVCFLVRVSTQQLLDALRQMPQLESLRIPIPRSQFSLPSSTTVTTSGAQATLPRLIYLDLGDSDLQHAQWFLARLTLPRLRRMVMLTSWRDHYSGDDSLHIAHAIAMLVTNGDFGTFEALDLFNSHFHLRMSGRQRDDNPHLHFSMRNEGGKANPEFTQTFLDMFSLCHSNLSRLVELKIEKLSMTVDEIFKLSTSLCSLRQIEIFRSSAVVLAFINVLAMLPPHHPAQSDAEIPFPALRSIMFSFINFASHPAILETLCDCLMLRYEYGVAIEELILLEGWVFSWQFSLLEEIVVDADCTAIIR
ncbi:hypothetical protein D9619_005220 [Psilocybe cf. subviscida]|uniref:F-box domain-containing protein n=1 Tax=Psilocybe cf. subviscida TaxID=2480587 RepID=A0A8H5BZ19_9AGAR|nr:hypothetical protein D9619_005220 [Psilocybe cf. subviscida]